MWIFYVLSLLPLIVGLFFWIFSKRVVWWEWLVSFLVSLVLALLFHGLSIAGMTSDYETWSGQVNKVVYYPRWVEETVTTVTDYDSKGNPCGSHTEYSYTTHNRHWTAYSNLHTDRDISEDTYNDLAKKFGNHIRKEWVYKTDFYSGDHHIYPCDNETGVIVPITEWMDFENRVKAAPSLFSFPEVPKGVKVYDYPKNEHWFSSDRVIGFAKYHISILEWDKMNARLGPSKHVNVIIIGFPAGESQYIAEYQKAKYIGGKKNDLVICYAGGGITKKPEWVSVFGWTEEEICKENLKSKLLNSWVNGNIIPVIEAEIRATYKIKDWTRFDYISIEPNPCWYYAFFIVMILAQVGYWFWALTNEEDKDPDLAIMMIKDASIKLGNLKHRFH